MNSLRFWLKKYVLGFVVWAIYRLLSYTWRVQIVEPDSLKESLQKKTPVIFAHWHGDELFLISLIRKYHIATIASKSKDGELMSFVIRLLGGATSRGSSSKGAIGALKGLITLMRSGYNCSFAVDGPRGPIYQVKPGVFETSRILEAPVFAADVTCKSKFSFPRSWNKTYLPKPFAQITLRWNGPIQPIQKNQDPRDPLLSDQLSKLLRSANQTTKAFDGVDP